MDWFLDSRQDAFSEPVFGYPKVGTGTRPILELGEVDYLAHHVSGIFESGCWLAQEGKSQLELIPGKCDDVGRCHLGERTRTRTYSLNSFDCARRGLNYTPLLSWDSLDIGHSNYWSGGGREGEDR